MKMEINYCYIQSQIVGSSERGFGYAYYSDLEFFKTKEQALKNGLKQVESDDFWIGEYDGKKIIGLWGSDLEKREKDEKELKGINEEFAFIDEE